MLIGINDDGVNPSRRNAHFTRLQRAARNAFFDLYDYFPATVTRRKGERLRIEVRGFVLETNISIVVRYAGAHDCNVHWKRFVAKVLATIHLHYFTKIVFGATVHLAAAQARVAHSA